MVQTKFLQHIALKKSMETVRDGTKILYIKALNKTHIKLEASVLALLIQ